MTETIESTRSSRVLTSLAECKDYLLSRFIGRADEINAILLSLVSKQHCVLLGPPGTGKSLIINTISKMFNKMYFNYLLTKFTTPDEIFGVVDIKKLREEGILEFKTGKKMPESDLVFLDEIFKGSSAILNALLMIMNERTFVNGSNVIDVPIWSVFGASNEGPERGLEALYDRFLFRVFSDYIDPSNWSRYMDAYWKIRKEKTTVSIPIADFDMIREMHSKIMTVDWHDIKENLLVIFKKLAEHGIEVSDRRKGRCIVAICASAVMDDRDVAKNKDLMCLKFIVPSTKDDVQTVNQIIVEIAGKAEKILIELHELTPQLHAIKSGSVGEIISQLDMLKVMKSKIMSAMNENDQRITTVANDLLAIFNEINEKLEI